MPSKKLLAVPPALFSLLVASSILSPKARAVIVRNYFRAETVWIDHYPFGGNRWAIQKLVPFWSSIGLLGPARVTVEPGLSLLLDPRDLVAATILRTLEWQPEVWESLSPSLYPGAVFLDAGAHIGYFSLKAAPVVGNTGRVVSFEPNPETLKILRDNVAFNRAQNVSVEPVACADRDTTLTLYAESGRNTGASALVPHDASDRPYSVRARPIDDVVRELKLTRVDAIKIDVEGAELSVLRGALDTLKRFHPRLVIEVVPSQLASFHTSPEDLVALVKEAGYVNGRPLNPEKTDWEWTPAREMWFSSAIRIADLRTSAQLLRGFHPLEANAWRWTDGRFAVALRTPPAAAKTGATLVLDLVVPEVALDRLKTMTLSCRIGETALPPQSFTTDGAHQYRRRVPLSTFEKEIVEFDFALDNFLKPAKPGDPEHGIIVTSVSLEPSI